MTVVPPQRGCEYASVEDLFDEEASGGIKPVAIGLLGNRQHLVSVLEAQLVGEQAADRPRPRRRDGPGP